MMPLWVGDFIIDTQELTDTEVGVYFRLLAHQWKKGNIPADPGRMSIIAPSATAVWDNIKEYFVPDPEDDTRLINMKCNEVKQEVMGKTRSNRRAAFIKWHEGEPFPEDLANYPNEYAGGDADG
jgi:uncharacterized protein YdaU (DUF1376 family)